MSYKIIEYIFCIYKKYMYICTQITTTKKIEIMETQFKTLKNGKNAQSCFANYETKQIVSANRNSFGYNVKAGFDKEFDELASKNDLKKNLGKNFRNGFSYSRKDVESLGFVLILRGETILF